MNGDKDHEFESGPVDARRTKSGTNISKYQCLWTALTFEVAETVRWINGAIRCTTYMLGGAEKRNSRQ